MCKNYAIIRSSSVVYSGQLLGKVQRLQNKFLRIILNPPPRTRTVTLHLDAEIDCIDDYIAKLIEKAYRPQYSNPLVACLGDYDVEHLPFKRIKCRLPKSFTVH